MGTPEIDKAAAALLKLARQVELPSQARVVITATSLAYQRDDGVMVVPLGLLGP